MHRVRWILIALGLLLPLQGFAVPPVLLKAFSLHDFDASITRALGYDTASVVYVREMATITPAQRDQATEYEPIGCFPFSLLRNGSVIESGYNCRSFFCVGYTKGQVQCKDTAGNAVGGVVEMQRRLSLVTIHETRKRFDEYPPADRTPAMVSRIEELRPYRCSPLYLLRFDVAVGEGYTCEQVGTYPAYSAKFDCVQDWRTSDPLTCSTGIRDQEFAIRLDIIESLASTGSVLSSQSSSSSASVHASFPDVIQGQYGFTAITDLASKGIVAGYPDGTFKPGKLVNRAEFSKLLLGSLRQRELEGETHCFPDVTNEWYSSYVCAARRLGWIRGYPDGTFRASQVMNKAEGMKIVIAALGYPLASVAGLPTNVADHQWYSPYVRKAVELRILLESTFDPAARMTRADASVWLYRSLKLLTPPAAPSSQSSVQ